MKQERMLRLIIVIYSLQEITPLSSVVGQVDIDARFPSQSFKQSCDNLSELMDINFKQYIEDVVTNWLSFNRTEEFQDYENEFIRYCNFYRNTSGDPPLHEAATCGNHSAVMQLVQDGADIDEINCYGMTPLYRAAQADRWTTVNLLLSLGANIDATDNEDKANQLYIAAAFGDVSVVVMLLYLKADFNWRSSRGYTALHRAARYAHMILFPFIINYGGDVDADSPFGTPLSVAAIFEKHTTMDFLIEIGANLEPPVEYPPLIAAVRVASPGSVRHLLQAGADPDHTDSRGMTALHWGVWGNSYITDDLLYWNASVNVSDMELRTPLHMAARFGSHPVMKKLLDSGADPNARDDQGWTPLHDITWRSARFGVKEVKEFIDHGADVNAADHKGQTPLHNSVRARQNLPVVKLLVRNGAHLNSRSNFAYDDIEEGKEELKRLIKLLLRGRFKIESSEHNGLTPLENAVWFRNRKIVKYLLRKGAIVNPKDTEWSPLHIASYKGALDIAKDLVEHGALVNATDTNGWTALHMAAWQGHLEMVSFLINSSADTEALDFFGWTPLHVAAKYSHDPIVKLLLTSGSDVNRRDQGGFTPLIWAVAGSYPKFLDLLISKGVDLTSVNRYNMQFGTFAVPHYKHTVALLVRWNADPNHRDYVMGWSPLHWAAAEGDLDTVQFLLRNGALRSLKSTLRQTPMGLARYWGQRNVYAHMERVGAVW